MKNYLVATAAASVLLFGIPPGAGSDDGQTFSHEKLSFGQVLVNTCKPKKVVITNNTGSAIQDPRLTVEGSREFKIQTWFRKKCSNPMQPGERCKGYVDFCPSFHKQYSAVLRFSGDDTAIPIYGQGNGGKY